MTAQSLSKPRFIRQTTLQAQEHNTNFVMLDNDIVEAISSADADQVTPLMSKIYLRLKTAPTHLWERQGVLRFEGETQAGKWVKAWDHLCKHLRVSSETASKALRWMHEQGIIGYSAFKNGVGIRIFLNRASSSIAHRESSSGKNFLRLAVASATERPASLSEPAFNDTFGVQDSLDSDVVPSAPKIGAVTTTVSKTISDLNPQASSPPVKFQSREVSPTATHTSSITVDELIARIKSELEPCVKSVAAQAAAQATAREVTQTRRWFEERALPKAIRVAQHETYDLLRKLGTLDERKERARLNLQVGRGTDDYAAPVAKLLTPEEITEAAETCLALLETQGKQLDVTLAEISLEGGNWLLPEDVPKVRAEAEKLLNARSERRASPCPLR